MDKKVKGEKLTLKYPWTIVQILIHVEVTTRRLLNLHTNMWTKAGFAKMDKIT